MTFYLLLYRISRARVKSEVRNLPWHPDMHLYERSNLGLEQYLQHLPVCRSPKGLFPFFQRENIRNQRSDIDLLLSERLQRRFERAAAGADDGDLINHDFREIDFRSAGAGRFKTIAKSFGSVSCIEECL